MLSLTVFCFAGHAEGPGATKTSTNEGEHAQTNKRKRENESENEIESETEIENEYVMIKGEHDAFLPCMPHDPSSIASHDGESECTNDSDENENAHEHAKESDSQSKAEEISPVIEQMIHAKIAAGALPRGYGVVDLGDEEHVYFVVSPVKKEQKTDAKQTDAKPTIAPPGSSQPAPEKDTVSSIQRRTSARQAAKRLEAGIEILLPTDTDEEIETIDNGDFIFTRHNPNDPVPSVRSLLRAPLKALCKK